MKVVNFANSGRWITIAGVPVVVLLPFALWVVVPKGKSIAFYVACGFALLVWWLTRRGWTIRIGLRRLRRLLGGQVLRSVPWFKRNGW